MYITDGGRLAHVLLTYEAYEQLGLGVREMLVVDPESMVVELFRGVDGVVTPVPAGDDGVLVSDVLGVGFATVDQRLQLTWDGGEADITVD